MSYFECIKRAVDFIENNLTEHIVISDMAKRACLSRFHFIRVFSAMVGETPGTYVRRRRLTSAAGSLMLTKERILDIALTYRFESQAAFTRAFKKEFSVTPAQYRKDGKTAAHFYRRALSHEALHHLIKGEISMEPKITSNKAFHVIGIEMTTTPSAIQRDMPKLWEQFGRRAHEIPNAVDSGITYQIAGDAEGGESNEWNEKHNPITVMACVEVSSLDSIPEGMTGRTIPALRYAVFTHKGGFSKIQHTYDYIYNTWAARTDKKLAMSFDFERYDRRFCLDDPSKSQHDIYVPIQ